MTLQHAFDRNDHQSCYARSMPQTWTALDAAVVEATGFSAKQIVIGMILEDLESDPKLVGVNRHEVLANILGSSGDSNTRKAVEEIFHHLDKVSR